MQVPGIAATVKPRYYVINYWSIKRSIRPASFPRARRSITSSRTTARGSRRELIVAQPVVPALAASWGDRCGICHSADHVMHTVASSARVPAGHRRDHPDRRRSWNILPAWRIDDNRVRSSRMGGMIVSMRADEGSTGTSCGIAVMAKASLPGKTKTRLVPPLTFEEAAAFNTAFLQRRRRQYRGGRARGADRLLHGLRAARHRMPSSSRPCRRRSG